MALFKAFANGVMVNGESVLSIINGMELFQSQALKVLEKHDIKNPQPGQWYPQQNWLDAFKEISETIGTKTLFAIGKKIPENSIFPPDLDSIEKALPGIDVAYHMNHRGGEGALPF
jgi:hypothetical protein